MTGITVDIRDVLAEVTFGISRTAALQQKICIDCKKPIADLLGETPSPADLQEYEQSGLCPKCFAVIEASEVPGDSLM